MESDDEMIVVVVDSDNNREYKEISSTQTGLNAEELMKIAVKHGKAIIGKQEEQNNESEVEDIEDPVIKIETQDDFEFKEIDEIKEEVDDDNDPTYIPDEVDDTLTPNPPPSPPPRLISVTYHRKKIFTEPPKIINNLYLKETSETDKNNDSAGNKKKKSSYKHVMVKNFVEELRQKYPELRDNKKLLVDTLEQIMRTMKPPHPPRDYYVMNGIMFECVHCGSLSDSIPAAARHYQQRHGPRYLICYACGVDFRSTTNLFKHEKRCISPDALLVLQARALYVGPKGRGRPYVEGQRNCRAYTKKTPKFACKECSAVFVTRCNLRSHENLHKGERPYLCPSCPAAYTSSSALSRHLKTHSDTKYTCDYCKRWFRQKSALVTHLGTHNPVPKFVCAECNRRFAQKAALVRHMDSVHLNLPPPCACQMCPRRYPRMYLLKAHMKKEHGMTIITRKMFFKSLPTMTENEIKNSRVVVKLKDSSKYIEQSHNLAEFLVSGSNQDFICVKNTSNDVVVQKFNS